MKRYYTHHLYTHEVFKYDSEPYGLKYLLNKLRFYNTRKSIKITWPFNANIQTAIIYKKLTAFINAVHDKLVH